MNMETRPFNALLEYLKHDKTLENRFVHMEKNKWAASYLQSECIVLMILKQTKKTLHHLTINTIIKYHQCF